MAATANGQNKARVNVFSSVALRKRLIDAGCNTAMLDKYPKLIEGLGAVLEYLVAEVLELAGNAARDFKLVRVKSLHIYLGILYDSELSRFLIINDVHWHAEITDFSDGIRVVLKQVHPDNGIDASGVATMNKVCAIVVEKMARKLNEPAAEPPESAKAAIEAVCTGMLSGELVKHAVFEASKVMSDG